MTDAPTLKPCPFCGSATPAMHPERFEALSPTLEEHRIACGDCGVTVRKDVKEDVIACWNQRAAEGDRPHTALVDMVWDFFGDDGGEKVYAWFRTKNPLLGGATPCVMIRNGRTRELREFVLQAMTSNKA